MTKLKIN